MSDPTSTSIPAAETETLRRVRYLAPNAVTAVNLVFGLMSLVAARDGNWALSGWMIIYSVLCDRLDGLVARALHATSDFGMQLDSFADFLNFGVAPAYLFYCYLSSRPDLPYASGGVAQVLLMLAGAFWVCCAVFRLARFNVQAEDAPPTKIFFGIPSTMAGGLVVIWFLVFHKYDHLGETFGGAKLLGASFITPSWIWLYSPIALVILGYSMVSSLPMPKGAGAGNKAITGLLISMLLLGYTLGFSQHFPEIMALMPTLWMTIFLVWGQLSAEAKGMKPPQLFPVPVRPRKSR